MSLNFHHSSLITHHSFFHSFGNITFIFITQFFHTIHGFHTCSQYSFFFFFPVPNSPKLIIIIKKKNSQPRKRKEKKKKSQKLRLWVPYMCLITILSLSYELWKQSYCLPNKLFTMGPIIFEL